MAKVIETNLTLDGEDKIIGFQSRVIDVENWESYIDEMKNGKSVTRNGTLYGESLPRKVEVFDFKYDSFHLSFSFYNMLGRKMKRLAYLININPFTF